MTKPVSTTRKGKRAVSGPAPASVSNGPNAAKSGGSSGRAGGVAFSIPENSGEAEAAIAYLESLTIPEGGLAGQPLRLAEYQRRFVTGALAPGVMVGLLSIGRGNAKTALASGLALGHLVGEWGNQPRREIILAARNRDQAGLAFQFMLGFIAGLPDDEQERFTVRRGAKLEIELDDGSIARCIPADGKSVLGGAPTLAIMDERASWEPEKGDNLENGILSGLGKRNGRALIISTFAPDDANTFSRWLDDPPPGTYVQEHRPAFGLPADDLPSLLEANPGAAEGIGSSPEWLVAQARRAIARGGSALASFRNLNRNERVSTEDRSVLVTVDEWLSAEVAPDDLPPREGPVVLGVDLGGSRSMSAAAFFWPQTGRLEAVGSFPGTPSLADRGASDGVSGRYEEMAERGELFTLGDATVPPGPWLAEIVRRLEGQPPACICGDRFRHAEFTEAMAAAGLGHVPFIWRGFGWKDGSEDIERFRRALFDGHVKVAPSMLLRSAFSDAVTLIDPAGNHKLAKARSLGRIDAAAAAVLDRRGGGGCAGRGAGCADAGRTGQKGGASVGVVRGSDGWLRYSRRVLKTRRWQVLRHQILERDGWACRECGETRNLEVDHVQSVRTAPKRAFDPSNLQVLCRRCHSSKTRAETGYRPVHQSPAHDAWKQAVAELATGNATA